MPAEAAHQQQRDAPAQAALAITQREQERAELIRDGIHDERDIVQVIEKEVRE